MSAQKLTSSAKGEAGDMACPDSHPPGNYQPRFVITFPPGPSLFLSLPLSPPVVIVETQMNVTSAALVYTFADASFGMLRLTFRRRPLLLEWVKPRAKNQEPRE